MSNTHELLAEIEAVASDLKLSATTIGRLVGQGGHFVDRLRSGKRVWPETAAKVRLKLEEIQRDRCDEKGAA